MGPAAAVILSSVLLSGCTGGQESSAAEEDLPKKNGVTAATTSPVDVRRQLESINPAIPLYAGARFRHDLTRRDAVMIQTQYGDGSEVYTLATDDSYPQVYHYYTTYLAQFRAFQPPPPYPPEQKDWRTLEVQLNQAMQDPFIPGSSLPPGAKQITLQIAETEAEPKTVIRYIVTPGPVQTASARQ